MPRDAAVLIALAAALAAAIGLSLAIGPAELGGGVLSLRAVRAALAALAGAALGVAGCLTQGLFRNPLAAPSVLGTSAGAALGGQLALLLHGALLGALPWLAPELLLPLGCVLGAGGALALLLALTARGSGLLQVLLVGFLLSTAFASCGALAVSLGQASWELGRAMVVFSLGSLDGKGPAHIALAIPLVAIGALMAWRWARELDLLLAGEEEARSLGVALGAARLWILCWVAVLTAAAVAVGGGVAFVGLVVPHLLRPLVGVGHRRLIPAAVLGGATYLVLCDVAARLIPAIGDVPLGVVTGLLGLPVFLLVLRREQRGALA